MSKKIIFHVVNSIKGGAGKSTFSLMLANYYVQKGKRAMVIDLDLQGTSWEDNYGAFFKNPISKGYINDLMYIFDEFSLDEYERRISVKLLSKGDVVLDKDEEDYCLPIYIANYHTGRIDDIQLDLFISAIYRLIMQIYISYSEEEIHIIFDMPPSKDKHAERVLTYLLLDINSPLIKKCKFHIKLYMMTNITLSHRNKNISYLGDLARGITFSELLPRLADSGEFELFFVMNDLSNVIGEGKDSTSNLFTNINNELKGISFTNKNDTEHFAKVVLLRHVEFLHKLQIFEGLCTDKGITDKTMHISFGSNIICNELIEKCNGKIK